ncbi:MAG: hypothetical protein ABSD69_01290 [Candidatus Levyibacteriota bacterium]
MNEKLPICKNCPFAEKLPAPLMADDGTIIKDWTCPPEALSADIIDKINQGTIESLPDKRSAISGLRKNMHIRNCPSSEMRRLADAPHQAVDRQRHEHSNITVTPSSLTIVDIYKKDNYREHH